MMSNPKKLSIDKLLLVSLVFILIQTSWVHAQKFSLGVKAGFLGLKSVYGDKDERKLVDDKIKWGYYGAGFISFPLKNHYTCVIETGFSQKGRKVFFDNGDSKNFATYYFLDEVLLLRRHFKLNLGKNIPADWFINVGPHVSYWLGGKGTVGASDNDGTAYKIKFIDESLLGDFNTMYMIDANRWLFGLDLGIGMTAPIKSTQRVMAELRFTWGHTYYGGEFTANYNWSNFYDKNLKANEKVLSLTIGYMWDFNVQESRKGHSTKDKEVKRKPVKRRRH
jgi:hypothetical protein